jgi:UDP-glucose 4-epimerase
MEILITGVAGFIGSNLVIKLLEKGHKITGIDNLSYGLERNMLSFKKNPDFKFIYGDIANMSVLKNYKADVVVHLASQKIPRYTNALQTLDENFLMLRNVVNKCVLDKSKIVFTSTSDVYGKNPYIPFTEEHDFVIGSPLIKRWAYATSKIYGEQFIIANADEHALKYSIVRLFGSYGPNQNITWWGGPQSGFITKAINKEPMEIHGDGLQTRTFTYVDDTIDGIMNCILNEKSDQEIFNVGSKAEEEISIIDLARLVWRLVNGESITPQVQFVPYSNFGKYEDVMRRVPDISKLKSYFNYNPKVSLEEGLKRTIEWQKKLL